MESGGYFLLLPIFCDIRSHQLRHLGGICRVEVRLQCIDHGHSMILFAKCAVFGAPYVAMPDQIGKQVEDALALPIPHKIRKCLVRHA
jgi:hypothetical protein